MNPDPLKAIDLRSFVDRNYNLRSNGNGMLLCPFHPDKKPSLEIFQDDGTWGWKCYSCDAKGTIYDFVMRQEKLDFKGAGKRIRELEGIRDEKRVPLREHPYRDESGAVVYKKVKWGPNEWTYSHEEGGRWVGGKGRHPHVLYRLDKINGSKDLILTEGERDAETLAALGMPATSADGGKGDKFKETLPFFKGKNVRIIYDIGNEKEAEAAASEIAKVAENVFILTIPGKDPIKDYEYDITDYISQYPTDEKKMDAFYGILANEKRCGDNAPLSRTLSEVEPRDVPWLWENFFPLGRATLVCGDPGCAKTWFCLDIAARLSKGFKWPDDSCGIGIAKTYYITVEDDLADTIRPRIDSLGGDPAMIIAYNPENPIHLDLSTPEGLERLERDLTRHSDVRLLVIDPAIDFSGEINPNASEEVRAMLTPLIRLAAKLNIALVLVGHLNKSQALNAIYRAGGTTSGWLGKCRAAFMVFRDKDDPPLRHIIPLKANLAACDPPQLEFRINDGKLDINVSRTPVNVDEHLNPTRGPDPTDRDEAVAWLDIFFRNRKVVPSTEVEAAAKAKLISSATLKRAKKAAGFKSEKFTESGGLTYWAWVKP